MTICALPDERHHVHAVHLPCGETVTVRPAHPQDTDSIQAYIRILSPASRRNRFLGALNEVSANELYRMTRRDEGRPLVFGNGKGGYAGWSRAKRDLDAVAGLAEGWTLHDLRRTAATRMGDLGVLPHVVEAILNHVSGHKAGVVGIYNRSAYATEKRAALDLWASHLQVAIAKASGANVHELRKQRQS